MAKITINSKTYELKKKTMQIAKKIEEMFSAQSLIEQYEKQFEFVELILKEEEIVEIFGSNNIDDIDLDELTLVCNMANDSYKEKINEQQKRSAEKLSNNRAIDKIIEAGKSLENINKLNNK